MPAGGLGAASGVVAPHCRERPCCFVAPSQTPRQNHLQARSTEVFRIIPPDVRHHKQESLCHAHDFYCFCHTFLSQWAAHRLPPHNSYQRRRRRYARHPKQPWCFGDRSGGPTKRIFLPERQRQPMDFAGSSKRQVVSIRCRLSGYHQPRVRWSKPPPSKLLSKMKR